jgi:hypothetical protein
VQKLPGFPQKVAASRKDQNSAFVLLARSLHVFVDGKIDRETNFEFEARSLDLNEDRNEIYVGSQVNKNYL